MYLLYSFLLALTALVTFPYFLVQGLRHGKYLGSFRERLGRAPERAHSPHSPHRQGDALWLHAVSVGELLACQSLVAGLKQRFPQRPLLVSTTTETGFRTAQQRFETGALKTDAIFYCPFDFRFSVRRVLRRVRPALLLVAETEFWPNLFREASQGGVQVVVVNARISDRSFPRYRLFRGFVGKVLNQATLLLAQSEVDAERLRQLGADPVRVRVAGNLKFDREAAAPLPDWLDRQLSRWTATGALVAGSTAAGEEELLLTGFERLREHRPSLRLLLAPRRPERFEEVAELVAARGFRLARRSQLTAPPDVEIDAEPDAKIDAEIDPEADVLLLDSMGELSAVYRYATVAFVGGSLVPHGGQNVLEAAQFARPVVVGPYMQNFRDIAHAFGAAGALRQVGSGGELFAALEQLFDDPAAAAAMGHAGRRLLEANRGATERVLEAVAALLPAPAEVASGQTS